MPDAEDLIPLPQHLWPKLIALDAPTPFGIDTAGVFYCHVDEPHDPPPGPPPPGGWQTITAYQLKDGKRTMPFRVKVESGSLPGIADVGDTVRRACSLWQDACASVSIEQHTTGDVDLSIGFDDLGGAKAGLTVLGDTSADGTRIRFNNGVDPKGTAHVTWDENNTGAGTSFFSVVAHELGHALGLLHATTRAALMFPTVGNPEQETLSDDDVSAVRALYGWEGQRPVTGIGTSTSPALCACGTRLAMAWKGTPGDQQIWFATSHDGVNWSPQVTVPSVATSEPPSLAFDGTRLWMCWKGVAGDPRVFYSSTTDFRTWRPQQLVANAVTSHGPAIAIDPRLNIPVVTCKGPDNDERLYWTMMLSEDVFLDVEQVMGVATSDRPAMTATGNVLQVAWKGAGNDVKLWYATFDSSALGINIGGPPKSFWSQQRPVSWVLLGNADEGIVGRRFGESDHAPSLVGTSDKTFIAWRAVGNDKTLWFSQHHADTNVWAGADLDAWSKAAHGPRPAGSSDGPALTLFKGRLLMAWKGIGSDHKIWTSRI